jgi:hypothetical protein
MIVTSRLDQPYYDIIVACVARAIVIPTVAIHTSFRILDMIQMFQNESVIRANDDWWSTILPNVLLYVLFIV